MGRFLAVVYARDGGLRHNIDEYSMRIGKALKQRLKWIPMYEQSTQISYITGLVLLNRIAQLKANSTRFI